MIDDEYSGGAEAESFEPASYEPQSPSEPQQGESAAPQSWKQDVVERHWNTLPDDLKGYLVERETAAHSRISEMGNTLSRLQQEAARMGQGNDYDSIFEKYAGDLNLPQGVDRATAIESLLAAASMLERPETRAAAVAQLLSSYGIDPAASYKSELQTVRQAEVQRAVDDFAKDKPHYGEIRSDVIQEIVALRQQAPGLDHQTTLRLAYERVMDRSPGMKARLEAEKAAADLKAQTERQKAERAETAARVKAARKAAGINVRSSPVRSAPKSMDDDLRAIARRVYGT